MHIDHCTENAPLLNCGLPSYDEHITSCSSWKVLFLMRVPSVAYSAAVFSMPRKVSFLMYSECVRYWFGLELPNSSRSHLLHMYCVYSGLTSAFKTPESLFPVRSTPPSSMNRLSHAHVKASTFSALKKGAEINGPLHLAPARVSSYTVLCGQHICVITLTPGETGGERGGGGGLYIGEVGGSGGGKSGGGGDGDAEHVACQPSIV